MAVAIDTGNVYGAALTSSATTVTSGSITVGSSDNCLIHFVYAYMNVYVAQHFTSVVWNSQSLSYLGQTYSTTDGVEMDVWYLLSPTPGTGTTVVTAPSAFQGANSVAITSVPLSGVNVSGGSAGAFGTLASYTNTTGSPASVTPTGVTAGGLWLASAQMNTSTITQTNANGTNLSVISGIIQSTDWIPGIDSGAFTWTGSGGGNNFAQANGFAILPGASTSGPVPRCIYVMP
jgi:hypothetical protein